MYKLKIAIVISVQLSSIILFAQTRKVSGSVFNSTGQPVGNSAVVIRAISDSSIIRGNVTNEQGHFVMENLDTGIFYINISHINYRPYWQKFEIGSSDVQLKDIALVEKEVSELAEVTVKAQKPLLSRSLDKLTLNIEGSVYERGENGLKLINVIPGMQVVGRDILFRGSEGVTIYVDNRRIMLPVDQLLAYLRSIPSESIKSYELKTVPGAENDAQNAGVVINVVLKPEYKYGLSGNVSTGYWFTEYNNYMGAASLNYRIGNITFQGGFEYRRSPSFYKDNIEQLTHPLEIVNLQSENFTEKYNTYSYNFGVDYKLTERQTIGFNINAFTNPGDISNSTTTISRFFANAHTSVVDSSINSYKTGRFKYGNRMVDVFYRNKLDSLGSKLDIGYSYVDYELNDPFAIETKFLTGEGFEFRPRDRLFTHNIGTSQAHVINLDLEQHFAKYTVATLGAKYTISRTDYSMDVRYGLDESSPLDASKSNSFIYKENILAIYGAIARSFTYWQGKIGLRAEQTEYTGHSPSSIQRINRNQWNLFPSAYLNRKIGENHSFTLSYSRRITRPGFRQLNPFIYYTSINSIQEGNPNLHPYYGNNLQLEYLLKRMYSVTFGFQNIADGITNKITNSGDLVISRDENIYDDYNFFISLYTPIKITSWWKLDINTTIRNTTINIHTQPEIHRSKLSENFWAALKFDLPKGYYAQISAFYNRNGFYGIYDSKNLGRIDFSFKKSFLNNTLTTEIELIDPFHVYRSGYIVSNNNFKRNVTRNSIDYARSFGIWLTYNFSGGKKQSDRENIDAGGGEIKRRL